MRAALVRHPIHEATRDERFADLFRDSLAANRAAADRMVDRPVARGELPADVDRGRLWELLPGWIMLRLVTGEALPPPKAAGAIVDRGLEALLVPSSPWHSSRPP